METFWDPAEIEKRLAGKTILEAGVDPHRDGLLLQFRDGALYVGKKPESSKEKANGGLDVTYGEFKYMLTER